MVNQLSKKELRNCIDCFKLVAKPVSQMMGDLPIERINPCRAFEKVGIDFAGLITTKCQHTRKLSAAFLSALRRFVSRHGYPSDIYSDNGTNFVGASAYLKDLFQLLHNSNVQDYSSSKNIQWHFIPPYVPNFEGVWEASVKLTKHHLLKTLKVNVLNFEEWSLLMKLKRMFWSRWQLSYLNTLQSRTKWMQGQIDLTVGSLVLIKNLASFSTRWTPGRIVATHPEADGICRVVTIQTSSGVMTRPVSQVAALSLPPSTTSSRPPEDVKNS
ncbi:integrase catalytic domain-containing protein [Trichonephila clavipes]|nr:integrase catalytic domain-containing protein [Trichonephila clavipes]